MSSEQVEATAAPEGPSVAEPAARRRTLRNLGSRRRCRHRARHPGAPLRPALPTRWPAGRRVHLPGLLHQRHARVPGTPRRVRPRPGQPDADGLGGRHLPPEHQRPRSSRCGSSWPVLIVRRSWRRAASQADPRSLQNLSESPTSRSRTSASVWAGDRPGRTSHCSSRSSCSSCSATGAGLIPPVGKLEELRAPTSDLNITIGLALVAFVYLRVRGLPRLGRQRLPGQVLPVLRVPEGHRGRDHRPVRRPDRAHARVRQAGHAVDATLRQHLRWRGRAGRRQRPDRRGPAGRAARARGHAELRSRRSSSASSP